MYANEHNRAEQDGRTTPAPGVSIPMATLFTMLSSDQARKQLPEQSVRQRPLRSNLTHAKFSTRMEMSGNLRVRKAEQMEAARQGNKF
ncbi:hypothetical protein DPMN_046806 [Dreissena polymorpha]|uniref:Uncharacterized protein n=1 Tax=Dreissena polymorpha TaxID=45954 RepID=A0A9D4I2J7_DREPO|nr:hypothetical protein DPMN_046806 [Dreissena polymorpha]